ncbi:archaeosortase/exosortase family protein [Chroococcidiopsis cubana]|uniref:archaeosortase/exosortase family protein n=1 Tax=Chroococcidiopsis cubana TaxID=171392 RepID=UPI0038FC6866
MAFVVNGVRVAILAILHAYTAEATFKYWHIGTGSQVFSNFYFIIWRILLFN